MAVVNMLAPVGPGRAVVPVVVVVVITLIVIIIVVVAVAHVLLHKAGRAAGLALVILPRVAGPRGAGADRLVLGVEVLVVLELVVADRVARGGRVDEDPVEAVLERLVVGDEGPGRPV